MLTPKQRQDFAQALAYTCAIRIFDGTDQFGDDITPTADPLTDFSARWGPPNEVLTAHNGITIHIWHVPRSSRDTAHHDLYVADFGVERATVLLWT